MTERVARSVKASNSEPQMYASEQMALKITQTLVEAHVPFVATPAVGEITGWFGTQKRPVLHPTPTTHGCPSLGRAGAEVEPVFAVVGVFPVLDVTPVELAWHVPVEIATPPWLMEVTATHCWPAGQFDRPPTM